LNDEALYDYENKLYNSKIQTETKLWKAKSVPSKWEVLL